MSTPDDNAAGEMAGTDFLSMNLEVLKKRHRSLYERLKDCPSADNASIVPSKAGPPTMEVRLPDGRMARLASAYDPVTEGKRFVDRIDAKGVTYFFVYGFAMGYHVEELLRLCRGNGWVFVLEANLPLFKKALEARDLREFLASKCITYVIEPTRADVIESLVQCATGIMLGVVTVDHQPSVEAFPEEYAELHESVKYFVTFAHTMVSTTMNISWYTKKNAVLNAGYYCFSAGASSLKDVLKGYPAVVAAAGPSLQKNVDLLKKVRGRGVLITMSTAIKPLLSYGVVPDFACIIDFSWMSKKYFEGLGNYPPVTLVMDARADEEAVKTHQGPKVVPNDIFLDLLFGDLIPDKGTVPRSSTVAHFAYGLAEYMGADPIVFVGLDLSFPDHLTYTPGTATHEAWQRDCNRFQTLEMKEWERILRMRSNLSRVKDINGNEIYTDRAMYTYIGEFERSFQKSDTTIVNATEGGALTGATKVMSMADALEEYFTRELPPDVMRRIESPQGGMLQLSDKEKVLDRVKTRITEVEEIRDFYGESVEILKMIEENIEDRSRACEFEARVQRLREEVARRDEANKLVKHIAQALEFKKHAKDRDILVEDLSDIDRQRRQLERDIEYVTGLQGSSVELLKFLAQALDRVADFVPWDGSEA